MRLGKIKKLFMFLLGLSIAFVSVTDATMTFAAETDKYTPENPLIIQLASGSNYRKEDPRSAVTDGINEYLKQKTGGAIQFEYKGGGQLAQTELDAATGLRTGTIPACSVTTGNLEGNIPALSVMTLPYLFESSEQVSDFLLNAPVMKDMMTQIEEKFNCVVIATPLTGMRVVVNNTRPIKKVADFSGLKIRIMDSPLYLQLFQALDANPTPMNYPDALLGMQQGTIDGLDNPYTAIYTAGTYKLSKYLSATMHGTTWDVFMVRKDIFDSLSAEHQQIVREAGVYGTKYQHEILFVFEKDCVKLISEAADSDIVVNDDVDREEIREAVMPLWIQWRDKIGPDIYDAVMKYRGFTS